MTVKGLNLSDCALLKSLTVVTERDAQFEMLNGG